MLPFEESTGSSKRLIQPPFTPLPVRHVRQPRYPVSSTLSEPFFHPPKLQKTGLQEIKTFYELCREIIREVTFFCLSLPT